MPSEALAGGIESNPPGSVDQKRLLCMFFFAVGVSVLLSSAATACSVPGGCDINIDQRNKLGLSKIFSTLCTSVLLGTHIFSHWSIEALQR